MQELNTTFPDNVPGYFYTTNFTTMLIEQVNKQFKLALVELSIRLQTIDKNNHKETGFKIVKSLEDKMDEKLYGSTGNWKSFFKNPELNNAVSK